ncbi:MAG: hypothetical protein GY822_17925 [Deltaproteobacteria bacterium]|nr:hypothetical protein [Deltaproteobacteria bacterium]
MAIVLGLSGYYHDGAAALLVDGKVVAAMQEERLSRIKNDAGLPLKAARACLSIAGLHINDVDKIVFYEEPFVKLERILVHLVRSFPRSLRQFPRAMASQLSSKLWVLEQIAEGLGMQNMRVETVGHHQSHAASAFFASGQKEAAVLVVDGVGEQSSTSIWHGKANELRLVMSLDFPHSLGLFYAAITAYLGFAVNEGEYKVMGLAAWGKPSRIAELEKLITFHDDGSYSLELEYFAHMSDAKLGFGKNSSNFWEFVEHQVDLGTFQMKPIWLSQTSLVLYKLSSTKRCSDSQERRKKALVRHIFV